MLSVNKIKVLNEKIYSSKIDPHNDYGLIADETQRISGISKNLVETFEKIDDDFKAATKLEKTDIAFLFLATGLQCVRQYILTNFKERENDQDSAKRVKEELTGKAKEYAEEEGKYKNLSGIEKLQEQRKHLYNPSLTEIIRNPVPFDTIFGAPNFDAEIAKHGGHRFTVLGHDPILGWIFGTANIATRTLTDYKFNSYHIQYGQVNCIGAIADKLTNQARTDLVFKYTIDKLNDNDGREKLCAALIKEYIHLKSDIRTVESLPLPASQVMLTPDFAAKLSNYGLDMENLLMVGKQASYSLMINQIISWVHYLMYSEEKDGTLEMYKVRTRKILSYSNAIASGSNILGVAIAASVNALNKNSEGVKKSLSYLDVGGFIVTLHRLISDHKFISQIKQEFIEKEMYKIIFDESLIEGV